jgi:hypothetical protein
MYLVLPNLTKAQYYMRDFIQFEVLNFLELYVTFDATHKKAIVGNLE